MPSFIIIETTKSTVTAFEIDAKPVLESKKFREISPGTYMSSSGSPSTIARDLKNLESYKKSKSSAGIKLYSGSLSVT